jgi:carbonic anhydrase/acetyltransferase-like protein (isoleucine patch superfamily)
MLLLLSFVLLGFVLLIPAIPTIREVVRPRDRGRLRIPENYVRDPRWFGRSYREKLAPFVAAARGGAIYSADLHLRTDEETRWSPDMTIPPRERVHGIAVGERIHVGRGAGIRDAYALEFLEVDEDVEARTLTSDGELRIGAAVSILRWIDADGEIVVAPDGDLGVSASGGGRVTLADRVTFERVWGKPVASRTAAAAPFALADSEGVTNVGQAEIEAGVPIFHGSIRIVRNTQVPFHIKVHGSLAVEPGVRIAGNAIVRGDVTFASDVTVDGHVFSEGDIRLGPRCRVGRPGGVKTVYAAGRVMIANDVEVEGWVVAESRGQTV